MSKFFVRFDFDLIDCGAMAVLPQRAVSTLLALQRFIRRDVPAADRRLTAHAGQALLASVLGTTDRVVRRDLALLRKLGWIQNASEAAPGFAVPYVLGYYNEERQEHLFVNDWCRQLSAYMEGLEGKELSAIDRETRARYAKIYLDHTLGNVSEESSAGPENVVQLAGFTGKK